MENGMHFRKLRILNALQNHDVCSSVNKFAVEDVQSSMYKIAYGVDFSTTTMNPETRMKRIKGWQEAVHQICVNIFQRIDELNYLTATCVRPYQMLSHQQQSSSPKSTSSDCMTSSKSSITASTTTTTTELPQFIQILMSVNANDFVVLGPNGTTVTKSALAAINWKSTGSVIVRRLLVKVFDRQTLATHSFSGKASPAFMGTDRDIKMQLNPSKVADIIYFTTSNLNITAKQVRQAITTKCADENRISRSRRRRLKKSLKIKMK